MATGDHGVVLRHLSTLFSEGMIGELTDAQLLERFTSCRDGTAELAFRALVERHGPMVLRVCRAVLNDNHDADDAFQATFLVLVRRAGSLWVRDSLGPWLHQVAHRAASCGRSAAARRARHELRAAELAPLASHDRSHDDLDGMVHDELARLPARYREAVVLCLLEGLTPEQAARHLSCPVGTVHSRLARGREQLRGRLIRRGLAAPVGLLAVGSAQNSVRASVPAALADSTVQSALWLAAGPIAAGAVRSSVAALTGAILRTTFMAQIKVAAATLLLFGALAAGVVALARQDPGDQKLLEAPQVPQPTPAKNLAASPAQPGSNPPTTDSLGDVLPPSARLRLGTLRFRPPSGVAELALSPDQKTIVTAGDELVAWDAATGKELWRARARDYGFGSENAAYGSRPIAFASDPSQFYTPGRDNEVVVWQTTSGRREVVRFSSPNIVVPRLPQPALSVDITPDGKTLAVGNAGGLVACDRQGKVLYQIVNAPEGPSLFDNNDRLTFSGHNSLGRFSPDGKILAVITSDRPTEIRLHDAATGRESRKLALASRLVRLAFSPDSRVIAATERDSAVRLYDVATGNRLWSHIVKLTGIHENYTSAIAFSPNGKTVAACATDNQIYLINPVNGEETGRLKGHHWYPWALAFTADSAMLYSSGWDPAIRRWDIAARKQLPLPTGVRATSVVAASPDGRTLAYDDDDDTIRLVGAENGTERRTLALAGSDFSRLVFSADGRQLAGGGASGDKVQVVVWDLPSGVLRHRWEWPKGRDPSSTVESLCFTQDGRRLAAAVFRQSAVYIWDLAAAQPIAQVAHDQVFGLSFAPDGKTLVTVGWDKIIRFWDTETGKLRRQVKVSDPADRADVRMCTVCYAPDGALFATAQLDGTIRIWQTSDLQLRRQFQSNGHYPWGAMSFSPDGLWLATGGMSGQVEVWDPLTGKRVWNAGKHQSYVYTVGFGRDASTLVTGGEDGVCYLWDLQPAGKRTDTDPARLWQALAGDDGPAAYEAMWALVEMPDRSIGMLADKLLRVRTLIGLEQLDQEHSPEEIERRTRMKNLLINKDPSIAKAVTVRRAISVLGQIGTPEAIAVLEKLASQEPKRDVGRLATDALDRLKIGRTQ
jgi:RNA polymerase sigma factor (sigma-70 family)